MELLSIMTHFSDWWLPMIELPEDKYLHPATVILLWVFDRGQILAKGIVMLLRYNSEKAFNWMPKAEKLRMKLFWRYYERASRFFSGEIPHLKNCWTLMSVLYDDVQMALYRVAQN